MSWPWSAEELRILEALYPRHGIHWAGWESALPDRTEEAIRSRAYKLRIPEPNPQSKAGRRMPHAKEYRNGERARKDEDPMEGYILWRMKDGKTPSDIDREQHWPEGRTNLILTERWKRERHQKGETV